MTNEDVIEADCTPEELDRILTGPRPVSDMERLHETGTLRRIIPELDETFGMTQNKYHSATVWGHTMAVLDGVDSDKLVVRMAALLHDVGKVRTREEMPDGAVHFLEHEKVGSEMAEAILERLGYDKVFIQDVKFLVRHHMETKKWGPQAEMMKDKKLRKLMYTCQTEERFRNLMMLIDADNKAHAEGFAMPAQVPAILERMETMKVEGSAMFGYDLPVTEEEVMRIKGLTPGPAVQECQDHLLKLAFVNPLISRDDLLKQLKGFKPRSR